MRSFGGAFSGRGVAVRNHRRWTSSVKQRLSDVAHRGQPLEFPHTWPTVGSVVAQVRAAIQAMRGFIGGICI